MPLARLLLLAGLMLAGAAWLAPAQAQCTGEKVTLSLLKPQNNPVYPAQIKAFEHANPCVGIAVAEVPFGQLADKISVLAASGNPPDILVYDGPNTQSYAAAGILAPLDEYMPPGLKEDILAASLLEHSWEGHVYSPGLQQTTLALFYNADMLAKAGIAAPAKTLEGAWTWAQAMAAFAKCQQGSGDDVTVWGLAPSRFGTGQPGFVYRDLPFLRTQGDPDAPQDSSLYRTYWAISPDGRTVQGWLNTPEAIAGAKFFQDMFSVAHITPKTGIPNAFQDGKACFTIDTSYFLATLHDADPGFAWGVTPMPHARAPIVHTGSITLGVTAKSAHKAAAAQFVMQVSTGRIALDFARERRILPVLRSLYPQMPELQGYPLNIFVEELRQWGHPRPPSAHFAQYDKIVSDALRDIAYGADPKTRLDAAVRALTPILSR
jgi:ABC-type glycerol-3-phosphate transport system substrate-binding protein